MRLLLTVILATPVLAQLYEIDNPAPISLEHGEYFLSARLQNEGGMLAHFGIGLFDRITLGASYGGNKFIGAVKPTFFPYVAFQARALIIRENGTLFPDLIVGFDNQGFGDWVKNDTISKNPIKTDTGYQVRPKGIYLVSGKTFGIVETYLAIGINYPLGINYWVGTKRHRHGISGFMTLNQPLTDNWELILEYDLNISDPRDRNRGFLNCGIAWTFNENLRLQIGLKDILSNRKDSGLSRIMNISYRESF